MEESKVSMLAYFQDIDLLEVSVSKNYYDGEVHTFYLRNTKYEDMKEIRFSKKEETNGHIRYYFENLDVDFRYNYEVVTQYGLSEPVQLTKLVKLEDFDDIFYYSGDDLGCTMHPDYTTFKVWAPTALEVLVCIVKDKYKCCHQLKRDKFGVFSRDIYGYYDNCSYTYLIRHYNSFIETTDPYAFGSLSNSKASVIIDLNKINVPLNRECLTPMKQKTDAIVYEASVRDFTMNLDTIHRGKFLGFVEEGLKTKNGNTAGFDYLCDLGVTHVQLLPVFDFATVDENHPTLLYNWGYDPMQYNVPEGSYATKPNDGYSRINEMRTLVSKLHAKGIRVVMDVVYNHIFDVNSYAFERIIPGYAYRKHPSGKLSNGSWCGNDLRSEAKMIRKYIVDMCKRWQYFYGMDGYRFDLMGILDIDTLNKIYHICHSYDPSFIMYGEGWDMNTLLDDSKKGMMNNHQNMIDIGFFNDQFRDILKGKTSKDVLWDKGYFAGNMYNTGYTAEYLKGFRYTRVDQSINYAECHDNATTFDKYIISNNEESLEIRKKRQMLLTMACILAQGIPFIHCGQEFYRSKKGVNNSYNSPDSINAIDWDLKDQNIGDIERIKRIIRIRKENPGFRYDTKEDVEKSVLTEVTNHNMITYTVKQREGYYEKLIVFINASSNPYASNLVNRDFDILYSDYDFHDTIQPLSIIIIGYKRY